MPGTTQTIAVLLVEDDAMVRGWVRMSLEGTEFRLAGEASNAREALELVPRRVPDVLLVDYRLPDGVGTELVRDLRRSGCAAPAVLMTANAERGFNELAREAGAEGTSLKTGHTEPLVNALRLVSAGGTAYDVRHPRRPPGRAALSPREREVIRLVAAGATNREIGERLHMAEKTASVHVSRILAKLNVRSRTEAAAVAHRQGLVPAAG